MLQQDPGVKPPDEGEVHASSRPSTDRRQKSTAHADQVLKCPRCDSLNTKFCYYNNYSLTQPRHFCKNCRRYWTKGGALRNVPIGGGCRKNKRVKQRTADPSSLVSLDENTSNMLASINTGNCSPLLPNFSGPSSSGFVDLSTESHRFGLTFSRLQESIRLGEQSGAVPSSQAVYSLGPGSSQVTSGLLSASCGQPPASLMSAIRDASMPSFEASFMSLGYPASTVKPEQGVLYNGSDLSSYYETPTQMAGATASTPTSLEDHFSSYSLPVQSFNGSSIESQIRFHHNKLALQMVNEVQGEDQGRILPAFEDERNESLRRAKGKSILASVGDVRSISEWQGVSESLFEPGNESSFWTGWPDMHTLAGSAAGAMLH